MCREEASELSSLKPQLEELGVPLVAVVKENVGSEIQDFRPHFASSGLGCGRTLFGPGGLVTKVTCSVRASSWEECFAHYYHVGILLEHKEKQFGDKVDTADVLKAAQKIVPVK
uniref:Peroxiredoxin-like 2A n=1 Tax=Xiphophorus maculatus TaxID=8083 RepID=A0A3B5Q3P6_XIPMA